MLLLGARIGCLTPTLTRTRTRTRTLTRTRTRTRSLTLTLGGATAAGAMASMAQRVAGVPPRMETGLLASGSLREVHGAAAGLGERCAGLGFHQATSLGDDLLLDLEQSTGEYCEP